MGELLIKYWLEFAMGTITGGIVLWCKQMSNRLKERKAEQDALKSGMVAILHDMLFQACNKYLGLGYIPVKDSEEILDNTKIIYDAYHALGGNGTGTDIYEKFKKLHVK